MQVTMSITSIHHSKSWKIILFLFLLISSKNCLANGELHLLFHMGGVAGETAFVGGTLTNTGDKPVAYGYVVVTTINERCDPLGSVIESFKGIVPGEKREFRIPLKDLHSYRIASLAAFDSEGFPLLAIDDNARLIKSRESEQRERCAVARNTSSK